MRTVTHPRLIPTFAEMPGREASRRITTVTDD
jgi:hypothetical protein